MIIKKSRSQEDHVPGPVLTDTKCGEPTAIISTLSEQDIERLVDAVALRQQRPAAAVQAPAELTQDHHQGASLGNHYYTFNFG